MLLIQELIEVQLISNLTLILSSTLILILGFTIIFIRIGLLH